MGRSRKALAVVAGPYRFYQVLWLYTQFPELEWSILLLPYGKGEAVRKDLHEKCKKLGIFEDVFDSDIVGQDSGKWKQLQMLLKMFFYYFIGKKKVFMERIIQSQTEGKNFDVFFVGCEYSIIEGSVIGLADEKEVYIFEEGLSDYVRRKVYPSLCIKDIISYVVTKMGYFSPYYTFELENTNKCIKYASLPCLLKTRKYKEIRQLVSNYNPEFKRLINSTYQIKMDLLCEYDVILFTTVFEGEIESAEQYLESIHRWLLENYQGKKILIKKHPRDQQLYEWKELKCHICDSHIPAEVILGMLTDQDVLMMEISTAVIQVLKQNVNLTIFRHSGMSDSYEEWMQYIKDILKIPEENIVCV